MSTTWESQLTLPLKEWRPIPFAPGYEVSAAGTVRRTLPGRKTYPGKIIAPTKHWFGYPRIGLTINGKHQKFELHIIVLITFVGPKPFAKAVARHFDGNPLNNDVSNLTWATHQENMNDMVRHGTSGVGERNAMAKLTVQDVISIRRDYAELRSLTKVAEKYGIAFQTVSNIVNRKTWIHVS